jgi:hypothetical protein
MEESKVLKKDRYGYQQMCQMVKLVYINHTQCPIFRKRPLVQCPQLFCCSVFMFLLWRPSYVTGDESSQRNWRRNLSTGIAGLYWSYAVSCIQKEAVMQCPTNILLLHVNIWHQGHHLSYVMNQVKVTGWRRTGMGTTSNEEQFVLWVHSCLEQSGSQFGCACN